MSLPVSVRRNCQQVVHCAEEALAVIENDEPFEQAIEDLQHARGLIDHLIDRLRAGGR